MPHQNLTVARQADSGKQKEPAETRVVFLHHCSERIENFPTASPKSLLRSTQQCFILMQRGEGGSASTYDTRTIIILMHFNKHYMQNRILIDQNNSHPNHSRLK